MKKIIILISVLACIFISGCNMQGKEKVKSLGDAYFYLLDKAENEEDIGIDDVKKLLKDYEFKILDHSEIHDVKGEKSYEYIFTGDDNEYLSVSFIVSGSKETIDLLTHSLYDDAIILMSIKGEKQWNYSIDTYKLDRSSYKKILGEIDELGISIQRKENQYSLEDACYYIIDKVNNNEDVKIDDIKKLLKDYRFESEFMEEIPEDNTKIYNYTFRNGDIEKIIIDTYEINNKEAISNIMHFISKDPELVLSFRIQDSNLSVSYNTNDKTNYKKAWDIINKK